MYSPAMGNDRNDIQIDIHEVMPLMCRGNGHHNWSLTKDRCECGELVGDDRLLDDVAMLAYEDDNNE